MKEPLAESDSQSDRQGGRPSRLRGLLCWVGWRGQLFVGGTNRLPAGGKGPLAFISSGCGGSRGVWQARVRRCGFRLCWVLAGLGR